MFLTLLFGFLAGAFFYVGMYLTVHEDKYASGDMKTAAVLNLLIVAFFMMAFVCNGIMIQHIFETPL